MLSRLLRFSEELAEKNNQSNGYFFLAFIIHARYPNFFTKVRITGN